MDRCVSSETAYRDCCASRCVTMLADIYPVLPLDGTGGDRSGDRGKLFGTRHVSEWTVTDMFHEVLLALAGNPGHIFIETALGGGGFVVNPDIDFIGLAEQQELNSIIDIGYRFHVVRNMIQKLTRNTESLYVRALCTAVQRITDEYLLEIAKVEREVLRLASFRVFTLAHLKAHFALYSMLFHELHDLLAEVDTLKLRGGELLNRIYERTLTGIPCLKSHIQHILVCVHGVFYRQLVAWVSSGSINDHGRDFIVEERMLHALQGPTMESSRGQVYAYSSWGGDRQSAARDELAWDTQFQLRLEMVPTSYLPYRVAEKVLFVGKSIKLLKEHDQRREVGFKKSMKTSLLLPALEEHEKETEHNKASTVDVMDGFIKAMDSLRKSQVFKIFELESELDKVHSFVTRRLHDMLMYKSNLEKHLLGMKEYFLLSKGEFFQCFIDEGHDMFKTGPTAFATQDINMGPLRSAGAKLYLENDPAFQCISFKLYAPSFSFSTFDDEVASTDLVLSRELASLGDGAISLYPSHGSALGVYTTGGSVMYREAKVVEHGFSSTIRVTFDSSTKGVLHFAVHNDRATALRMDDPTRAGSIQNALVLTVVREGNALSFQLGIRAPSSRFSYANELRSGAPASELKVLGDASLPFPTSRAADVVELTARIVYRHDASDMCTKCFVHAVVEVATNVQNRLSLPKKIALDVHPLIECALNLSENIELGTGSDGGQAWVLVGCTPSRPTVEDPDIFSSSPAFVLRSWAFQSVIRNESSFDSWTKLQLKYQVPWPLHIIITLPILVQYNEVFRFLFTIRRVSSALNDCWATLLRAGKEQYQQQSKPFIHMCRLRTRMGFFVDAFQYFLHVDVIESQWHALQESLKSSDSFHALRDAHAKFITSVKRQCLLDARTLRKTLDSVLNLCVRLCNLVYENKDDIMNGISQFDVERVDAEYSRHSNYLFLVLAGISPNLKTRLDFNGHFTAATSVVRSGTNRSGVA